MLQLAFSNASELSRAMDKLFEEFPIAMYYGLDTIAPFPDFQSHDGFEFYYVWQGDGAYVVGNNVFSLEPGTIMMIRPRAMHKTLQTDSLNPVGRHVLFIQEHFIRREGLAAILPELDLSGPGIRFTATPEIAQKLDYLYKMLHEELTFKAPGYAHAIAGIIRSLIVMLRRCDSRKHPDPNLLETKLPSEIIYLIQFLGSTFQEPLTLAELAKKVHMNTSYVSYLFHRYTGYTIRQFIMAKRIHHGKMLLTDTDLPIPVISAQCGYKDVSQFIRTFKKLEDTTPHAFRKLRLSQKKDQGKTP